MLRPALYDCRLMSGKRSLVWGCDRLSVFMETPKSETSLNNRCYRILQAPEATISAAWRSWPVGAEMSNSQHSTTPAIWHGSFLGLLYIVSGSTNQNMDLTNGLQ